MDPNPPAGARAATTEYVTSDVQQLREGVELLKRELAVLKHRLEYLEISTKGNVATIKLIWELVSDLKAKTDASPF